MKQLENYNLRYKIISRTLNTNGSAIKRPQRRLLNIFLQLLDAYCIICIAYLILLLLLLLLLPLLSNTLIKGEKYNYNHRNTSGTQSLARPLRLVPITNTRSAFFAEAFVCSFSKARGSLAPACGGTSHPAMFRSTAPQGWTGRTRSREPAFLCFGSQCLVHT